MPSSLGKRGREDSVSSNSTGDFALARGLARRQLMIARLSISEPNPEEGGRPGRFPRPNTVKQPSLFLRDTAPPHFAKNVIISSIKGTLAHDRCKERSIDSFCDLHMRISQHPGVYLNQIASPSPNDEGKWLSDAQINRLLTTYEAYISDDAPQPLSTCDRLPIHGGTRHAEVRKGRSTEREGKDVLSKGGSTLDYWVTNAVYKEAFILMVLQKASKNPQPSRIEYLTLDGNDASWDWAKIKVQSRLDHLKCPDLWEKHTIDFAKDFLKIKANPQVEKDLDDMRNRLKTAHGSKKDSEMKVDQACKKLQAMEGPYQEARDGHCKLVDQATPRGEEPLERCGEPFSKSKSPGSGYGRNFTGQPAWRLATSEDIDKVLQS
ncbi:MAG: hypothetical protein LQ338_000876 [Usnochroma carphineum]|nr:MAG: hypothetical protein LQ338_000876 [Usnochroma carphineum]